MKNLLSLVIVLCFCVASPLSAFAEKNSSYSRCLDEANGVTSEILMCIGKEHAKWDRILNINYKKALNSLSTNTERNTLKVAQRAWIDWRNKMADAFIVLHGGGSLSRIISAEFLMEATKLQAQRLDIPE